MATFFQTVKMKVKLNEFLMGIAQLCVMYETDCMTAGVGLCRRCRV